MKLLHAAPYLRVADVRRSLHFYCDLLGFSVLGATEQDGRPFFARLGKDGFVLLISDRPSRFIDDGSHDGPHEHDAHGRHVFHAPSVQAGELNLLTYFYVEDADAAYAELTARGLQAEPPEDRFFGLREFLVRDPDGYYVAIAHYLR